MAKKEDFISLFESIEDMACLLDEHWAIYSLDKDFAYFILLPNPVSSYNIINHQFLWQTYYEDALKIAKMPYKRFLTWSKLFEKNKNPPPTVMIQTSARSGSTLFGAMLHHEGYSVVYGEPPIFSVLVVGYVTKYWDEKVRTKGL
uniref:Sulfotransferase n=1 Tax=Acrobeloides nanus TaxID=290746 RepID=A0A914DTF4_9BILA